MLASTCVKGSAIQTKHFTVGTPGKEGLQPAEGAELCSDLNHFVCVFCCDGGNLFLSLAPGESLGFAIKPKRCWLHQSEETEFQVS